MGWRRVYKANPVREGSLDPTPKTLGFLLLLADSSLAESSDLAVFAWYSIDRPVTEKDKEKILTCIKDVKVLNEDWEYEDLQAAVERQLEEMGYLWSGAAEDSTIIWTNPLHSNPSRTLEKNALVAELASLIKSRNSSDVIIEIIGDLNLTTGELEEVVSTYEKQFYTTPGEAYVEEISELEPEPEDMWWEGASGNPKLQGERMELAVRLAGLIMKDMRRDDPALNSLLTRLTRSEIEYFIERCGESTVGNPSRHGECDICGNYSILKDAVIEGALHSICHECCDDLESEERFGDV